MTRFSCIGASCEATCCAHWSVPIDKSRFKILTDKLEGTDQVGWLTKLPEPARNAETYGLLQRKDDGTCRFLDTDALCTLQKRFGERVLPTECSMFPRYVQDMAAGPELSATLACPEVARLALLAVDGTMPDVIAADQVPRQVFTPIGHDANDPYERVYAIVLDTLLTLLAQESYSLASRLFFLGFFANGAAPFLHRGAPTTARDQLSALRAKLTSTQHLDQLASLFSRMDLPDLSLERTLIEIIASSVEEGVHDTSRMSFTGAMASYPADAPETAYRERVRLYASVPGVMGRIDSYLARLSAHYFMLEPYIKSENVMDHLFPLALRVALAKFLLVGQPGPFALIERSVTRGDRVMTPEMVSALDAGMVQVAFNLSRSIDHNTRMRSQIAAALKPLDSIVHLAGFLKFIENPLAAQG